MKYILLWSIGIRVGIWIGIRGGSDSIRAERSSIPVFGLEYGIEDMKKRRK